MPAEENISYRENQNPNPGPNKYLILGAVTITSLSLAYFAYLISGSSTEQRPRAATGNQTIYEAWEFNKTGNTEGWYGNAGTTLAVNDGILKSSNSMTSIQLSNDNVVTSLPEGNKGLSIRLRLKRTGLYITPTQYASLKVNYRDKERGPYVEKLSINILADDQMHQYNVPFNNIKAFTLEGLDLTIYDGGNKNDVARIDWIRIKSLPSTPSITVVPSTPISQVPTVTPTAAPPIGCTVGIKSISFYKPCPTAKYFTEYSYVCLNDFNKTVNQGGFCMSMDEATNEALATCSTQYYCPPPTPTFPRPSKYPTYTPTPGGPTYTPPPPITGPIYVTPT